MSTNLKVSQNVGVPPNPFFGRIFHETISLGVPPGKTLELTTSDLRRRVPRDHIQNTFNLGPEVSVPRRVHNVDLATEKLRDSWWIERDITG